MARLAWLILIGAVLNGMAGLALAVLRALGVLHAPWALLSAPLWIPLVISGVLAVILLLHAAFHRAQHVALDELAASDLAVR